MLDGLLNGATPNLTQIVGTALFSVAVLHTFSTKYFEQLAHVQPRHAGLWHLLGEVEVVFGFWAMVFLLFFAFAQGPDSALHYVEDLKFTEPAFIFVIMVIAASKPILDFSGALMLRIARMLPLPRPIAYYATVMSLGPLLGSFITEPAAMTLCALLLRERYFSANAPSAFKYATLAVLFVNVSIGGTLTPFAAPPVLMVAERWGWDFAHMIQHFGWRAAIAVFVNAAVVTVMFRSYLREIPSISAALARLDTPRAIIAVHLIFLCGVILTSHHPTVFVGLFLFFLGFTQAYQRYQSKLILREGLLVGFFLAGLVVLGSVQGWWLQPLLTSLSDTALYYGATLLTAITDNAALTYLGSLVNGLSPEGKYALVAGAVTGGGLTVIANAPNPAGLAILKGTFDDGAVNPLWLTLSAIPPTLTAVVTFRLIG